MEKISYFFLKTITFPFRYLPYHWIHKIGNFLGLSAFYVLENFRKRSLSNLALATDLDLSKEQIVKTAKESFQNLMITCLEYAKFDKEKNIKNAAICINSEKAQELIDQKTGVIFFCGHQANWEVLFLEGTTRMPGVAIGKPTRNKHLYQWVVSIREKFGGRIIPPKNAIKEGLRALKQGKFLGIVGDQGMPDSGFCSPFLGRPAFSSPIPAMLSYRSQCPIIVATTQRNERKYTITYSDPIWPNLEKTMEEEIPRMMLEALSILQRSIKDNPGQWLWQHNRWKVQLPGSIIKKFRLDSLCIILPDNELELVKYKHIATHIRKFYPTEFILFMAPKKHIQHIITEKENFFFYDTLKDCFIDDYRMKFLINLTDNNEIEKHFKKKSVLQVLNIKKLLGYKKPSDELNLVPILEKVLYHAK